MVIISTDCEFFLFAIAEDNHIYPRNRRLSVSRLDLEVTKMEVNDCMTFGTPEGRHVAKGRNALCMIQPGCFELSALGFELLNASALSFP